MGDFVVLAIVLLLFPNTVCKASPIQCIRNELQHLLPSWHKAGDIFIGGITSHIAPSLSEMQFEKDPSQDWIYIPVMITKFFQHVLALVFTIDEINRNPNILPNVTLGFHIQDSLSDSNIAYRTTLDLLFRSDQFLPNYKCGRHGKLLGVIGGLTSYNSLCMSELLGLYKVPQLAYGSFPAGESEEVQFPLFYHMAPGEDLQLWGIVQLLQYFKWKWIGLFTIDDKSGEHFLEALKSLLSEHGICLAFTKRIPKTHPLSNINEIIEDLLDNMSLFEDSRVNAMVVYGESVTLMWLADILWWNEHGVSMFGLEVEDTHLSGKVWVTTAQIDFIFHPTQIPFSIQTFSGALSISIGSKKHVGFQKFLQEFKPSRTNENIFINNFWRKAFGCIISNSNDSNETVICTGEEELGKLHTPVFEMGMTGHSYSIYNAAYAMAHSLHKMYSFNHRAVAKDTQPPDVEPWQLHSFLRKTSFNNSAGEEVILNSRGEVVDGFDLINLITFPNTSYARVKVGRLTPRAFSEKEFTLNVERIQWHKDFSQVPPVSVCNNPCQPGFHKNKKEVESFCCYDCLPCEEGKISDHTDMDDCINCPEDQYPNEKQTGCSPKVVHFLSYNEPLGATMATFAVSLSLTTCFVLGVFIKHRQTPLVKANNQGLSYSLLVALVLSFLCVFLFLGRPTPVTCLLRQTSFGIIFSVAISCILAKTITVVLAFLAIQPGSQISKWVGRRLPISIVLSCSLGQAGILATWLGFSPPFPGVDRNTLAREMVLECNEGSSKMFYGVLGYLGFLSSVSFIVAFLAKNLPDSFNEAKFITFSMLVFCSVWLSFVPTYLSSKGKYMVAVEIFSILASSSGLLSCIYFPKCYVILLRPDLNSKGRLTMKKK